MLSRAALASLARRLASLLASLLASGLSCPPTAGERCVTAFVKPEQLSRRIEKRDAFDFLIHDLKHMENFVGPHFDEQVGLLDAVGSAAVRERLAHLDGQFQAHFAYVLADMNSRADHLFAFFKAKLLCGHVRWLAAQEQRPESEREPEPEREPEQEQEPQQAKESEGESGGRIFLSPRAAHLHPLLPRAMRTT